MAFVNVEYFFWVSLKFYFSETYQSPTFYENAFILRFNWNSLFCWLTYCEGEGYRRNRGESKWICLLKELTRKIHCIWQIIPLVILFVHHFHFMEQFSHFTLSSVWFFILAEYLGSILIGTVWSWLLGIILKTFYEFVDRRREYFSKIYLIHDFFRSKFNENLFTSRHPSNFRIGEIGCFCLKKLDKKTLSV